jgi:hypothetical protein
MLKKVTLSISLFIFSGIIYGSENTQLLHRAIVESVVMVEGAINDFTNLTERIKSTQQSLNSMPIDRLSIEQQELRTYLLVGCGIILEKTQGMAKIIIPESFPHLLELNATMKKNLPGLEHELQKLDRAAQGKSACCSIQ